MTTSPTTSTKPLGASNRATSGPSRLAVRAIRGYQRLTKHRVAPCRFYPSCSNYALEAVQVHGARRGVWLAVRRISKCRPLGPHGIDLVPLPSEQKKGA